mmetsp:Transcript_56369/g.180980  ORF Transcript_56369/g.180980 Transcript_56369/m.180980 type:complete len:272 (+) Transcript_56369:213-1028(+)
MRSPVSLRSKPYSLSVMPSSMARMRKRMLKEALPVKYRVPKWNWSAGRHRTSSRRCKRPGPGRRQAPMYLVLPAARSSVRYPASLSDWRKPLSKAPPEFAARLVEVKSGRVMRRSMSPHSAFPRRYEPQICSRNSLCFLSLTPNIRAPCSATSARGIFRAKSSTSLRPMLCTASKCTEPLATPARKSARDRTPFSTNSPALTAPMPCTLRNSRNATTSLSRLSSLSSSSSPVASTMSIRRAMPAPMPAMAFACAPLTTASGCARRVAAARL